MRYSTHGKRYFAVAFGNCGGGYEIRNPFFKGCVPPKDVTLLPSGSAVCNVYEGFVDYLSARALGIGGGEDHLVLNSVSNVARAYRHLDGYGTVRCHLDNDEAGRKTTSDLIRLCPRSEVIDQRHFYSGHKDVNDYLIARIKDRPKTTKTISDKQDHSCRNDLQPSKAETATIEPPRRKGVKI